MRVISFIFVTFCLISCSTTKKEPESISGVEGIRNEDFKKVKPVEKSQVRDYFTNNRQVLQNPVLKDETIERLTTEEVKEFRGDKDPLVAMAFLCNQRKYKEAYALASSSYDRLHKIPSYWNQLGICYLDQKEFRKSLLYFNKALEVQKDYVPTLNNFGVMYARLGQPQKAIVAFERAANVGKFSKTPRYNLAKLYLEYGLSAKALPILQSLSNQVHIDVGITNSIATAHLMQGDHSTAITFFNQLSPKLWEKPEIGINFALAHYLAGNRAQALKIYKNLSKPKQQDLKNYYNLMAQKIGVKL